MRLPCLLAAILHHCHALTDCPACAGGGIYSPFQRWRPSSGRTRSPRRHAAQETTTEIWSHRSHTEAGLAPFMPAGSLGGLGEGIRGAGHGTQVTNLEMQPDTSHSTVPARPPNSQKRPCRGARSAGPTSLTESVSFGSHPAHPPLQSLCSLQEKIGNVAALGALRAFKVCVMCTPLEQHFANANGVTLIQRPHVAC